MFSRFKNTLKEIISFYHVKLFIRLICFITLVSRVINNILIYYSSFPWIQRVTDLIND